MKKFAKISIVLLITLITIITLSTLVVSVKAVDNTGLLVTSSTNNKSVSEDAINTITINYSGSAQLNFINITIPNGYTNVRNIATSDSWTINRLDNYILLNSTQGLSSGQTVTITLEAKNPPTAQDYKWVIQGAETTTTGTSITPIVNATNSIVITTINAALIIFAIAAGIAILNTGLNRVLINYFVGWEQYRVMQKEMNEYRQETMAAARANDKKQMEKLKRKQSQVNAMQAKMMKPQMVQFGISFLYIFVWFFVLTPTFGSTSLVYLPGFGPISVIYWYPICSFFLGILSSRLLGIMPIENQ